MSSRKILVTGGSGYLGRSVCEILGAESASRSEGSGLFDAEMERLLSRCDVIVHMAACVDKHPESASECFHVNADGSRWLAQRLKRGQTLIYCSTKDVYNSESELHVCVPETCSTFYEGQTAYAWSKFLGEEYARYFARKNGFRLGVFRLSTIFASAQSENQKGGIVSIFARSIRAGAELQLECGGLQVRDILPISEACRAFALFLNSNINEGTFNLGGGSKYAFTMKDLALRIGSAVGVTPKVTVVESSPKLGEQFSYVSDISRLNATLGWSPSFNPDDHLRRA